MRPAADLSLLLAGLQPDRGKNRLTIPILWGKNRLRRGSNSVVECQLPKLKVAGPNPVSRSNKIKGLDLQSNPFFIVILSLASVFASVCI